MLHRYKKYMLNVYVILFDSYARNLADLPITEAVIFNCQFKQII